MKWQCSAPLVQLTSPPTLTEAATGQVPRGDDEEGEGLTGSQLGGGFLLGELDESPHYLSCCECVWGGWGLGDALGEVWVGPHLSWLCETPLQ